MQYGKRQPVTVMTYFFPQKKVDVMAYPILWNTNLIQLIVHKDPNYSHRSRPGWLVSEYTTGMYIGHTYPTRYRAAVAAIKKIKEVPNEITHKCIKEWPIINKGELL